MLHGHLASLVGIPGVAPAFSCKPGRTAVPVISRRLAVHKRHHRYPSAAVVVLKGNQAFGAVGEFHLGLQLLLHLRLLL